MKCKICCIENELKLSVLLLCSVIVNRNWIELSKVYIYYYYYFYYYHYHYILLRNKVVVVYCLNDWPGKWTFVLPIFQHCLTWYFLSKYWFFQEKGNYEDSLCISYFGVLHTASSRYVTNILNYFGSKKRKMKLPFKVVAAPGKIAGLLSLKTTSFKIR